MGYLGQHIWKFLQSSQVFVWNHLHQVLHLWQSQVGHDSSLWQFNYFWTTSQRETLKGEGAGIGIVHAALTWKKAMGCGSKGVSPISTNIYKPDEDDQVKCMWHPSIHCKQSQVLCDYAQMKSWKIYYILISKYIFLYCGVNLVNFVDFHHRDTWAGGQWWRELLALLRIEVLTKSIVTWLARSLVFVSILCWSRDQRT